jgi:hypothetical protein
MTQNKSITEKMLATAVTGGKFASDVSDTGGAP